jgi:hypothetical protein
MTSNLDTTPSRGDRARTRAYLVDFVPAMAAYCVVLPLVLHFGDLDGTNPWRYGWSLLPLIPALGVVRAAWRHLARLDEYQRDLVLRSFAIGFLVMIVVTLTSGFLAMAGLHPDGLPWILYGAGMLGWGGASIVLSRRANA